MLQRLPPLLAAAALACSSEPAPSGNPDASAPPVESYAGVLAGPDGESGLIELDVAVDATRKAVAFGAVVGSFKPLGGGDAVNVDGTVNSDGSALDLAGTAAGAFGAFTCDVALVDGGGIRGKCYGADTKPRAIELRVAPVDRFCGTFRRDTGEQMGAFNLILAGSYASAVLSGGIFTGSAPGSYEQGRLNLSVDPIGSIMGDVVGDDATGSWNITAVGMGDFQSSIGACP